MASESVADTVRRIDAARRKAGLKEEKRHPFKGPTPMPDALKKQAEVSQAIRRGDISTSEARNMGMTGGVINMLKKKMRIGGK